MVEWLENPRKAPRVRLRLDAKVLAGAATFDACTEDLGPHGCQLVVPQRLPRGAGLRMTLRFAGVTAPLTVGGAVAWASQQAPWRLGVAFDEAARAGGADFFGAVVAARPDLADWQRVPARISLDAMVWLAPPPRLVVDFTADEVAVLRAIGSGASVFELRARLRTRWAGGLRGLFSLLAGRHVTLERGGAVPYANWAALLNRLEAELAVGSLEEAPAPVPARRPALVFQAAPRLAGYARSLEAAEAYRQALVEQAAGRQVSALALLRAALAMAPGDLEIARKVGEVASARR